MCMLSIYLVQNIQKISFFGVFSNTLITSTCRCTYHLSIILDGLEFEGSCQFYMLVTALSVLVKLMP
jgi:hypothetical protein